MNSPENDAKCSQESATPKWESVGENLVRYVPSGTYFARVRIKGKLIVKSLKTKSKEVAKLRKNDLEKAERAKAESQEAVADGKMTFGDALESFRLKMANDLELKPRSKDYREERITALLKSWPGLASLNVKRVTKAACLGWAARFAKQKVSPTAYNNTIGTVKLVMDEAVEAGAIYDNPARFVKRLKIKVEEPKLPSQEDLEKVLSAIKHHGCADLVRFLAYGGFRLREARNIRWQDIDWAKNEIAVRGDEIHGTKNGERRRTPIIPDMRVLLERLQSESPDRKPEDRVIKVNACQRSIDSVCGKLGIARFTHHTLRHLFCTRCLECGVHPKAIAQWVGHKDGGALILTRYGHARADYAAEMSQKVRFSAPSPTQPSNVVAMPQAAATA